MTAPSAWLTPPHPGPSSSPAARTPCRTRARPAREARPSPAPYARTMTARTLHPLRHISPFTVSPIGLGAMPLSLRGDGQTRSQDAANRVIAAALA